MSARTVYRGATLFDGTGATPVADTSLVVDGDVIVAVGPAGEARLPDGSEARQVDLAGRWLMPGLIDAHVHLQFPLRVGRDVLLSLTEPLEYTTLKAAFNAQVYLAAGFTTVMDAGCRGNIAVALREAIARGLCSGPRIVANGLPLSPTAGWADEHASFVHNDLAPGGVADSPDAWRRAIRLQAKDGVDSIKIGVSGSSMAPYSDPRVADLDHDEIAFIVREAHRVGCAVAAHCDPGHAFIDAVRAGVDTIHHGFGVDEAGLAVLAESSTYYVPTAMKRQALIEEGATYGRDPASVASLSKGFGGYLEMLGRAIALGLGPRIAVGSDAGNLPPRHGTTLREIAILEAAGMTPSQALESATRVGAEAIGMAEHVGTLEIGKKADFLVLDRDPLSDRAALAPEAILAVYQGGRKVAEHGRLIAELALGEPCPSEPIYARRSRVTRRPAA